MYNVPVLHMVFELVFFIEVHYARLILEHICFEGCISPDINHGDTTRSIANCHYPYIT